MIVMLTFKSSETDPEPGGVIARQFTAEAFGKGCPGRLKLFRLSSSW